MNYDMELSFLREALRKLGIQTLIADLQQPIPMSIIQGIPAALPDPDMEKLPLEHFLPDLQDATVYNMTGWFSCSYIYFVLPRLQPRSILVIGPYVNAPISAEQIIEQVQSYHVDARNHKRIERFYAALPVVSKSSQVFVLLETFYERIWGAGAYNFQDLMQSHIADTSPFWPGLMKTEKENLLTDMALMEERYAHENNLIAAVREGKLWRVEALLSRLASGTFEQRSPDPLRNVKNYCIITNTLLRKAAEQGGVHPLYIDSVSSSFALQIEQLPSVSSGIDLIGQMAKSYCALVRNQATKGYSPPVHKAIVLIDSDLSADLHLSGLAQQINVNSSYLSALFKKETGSTITEFITQRRMRHACSLLENSRLQIQTVAQLCGYEDIHYFSKLFKRHTGVSPKEYQRK